jgi:nucleotide-binding universal stress UspA family protein
MKVVIAVEDSQYSQDLIEEVISRPWPRDTSFKILTVIEPIEPLTLSSSHGPDIYGSAQEQRRRRAEKICGAFRHKLLQNIAHSFVHFEVREGHIKDEIIKSVTDWEADKIMLGANTGLPAEFKRTGSTCKTVAHHAPCAVEVIVPIAYRQAKKGQSQLVLK